MKLRHLLQLIFLASLWGISFIFNRIAVGEFGAVPLSNMRSVIAALILVPMMLMVGQWQAFARYWKQILIVAVISTALPFSLLTYTTQYTSAGFAAILQALTPIFSALTAWAWLKEYLSVPAIIGVVLGFLGVQVMVFDTATISSASLFLPILTGLGAAFFYGLTGSYTKKHLVNVPSIAISAGCQFFGALVLLPFTIMVWPSEMPGTAAWLSGTSLGVFCTALGYVIFFHLISQVGVTKTIIVTYLIPVFAMLWGFVFLGEAVTLQMAAGAVFILAGITLTSEILKKRSRRIYET